MCVKLQQLRTVQRLMNVKTYRGWWRHDVPVVGRLEQHVDILLRGSAVSGKRNVPRGQIFLRGNVIQPSLAGEKNLSRKGDALHDITPLEMYKCYLDKYITSSKC